ncbi:MAG: ankyrin repeat domain-containing protein [Bacillota bacterium]
MIIALVVLTIFIGLFIFFKKWAKIEKEKKLNAYKRIKGAINRGEFNRFNRQGESLLMESIREGFKDLIDILLSKKIDINHLNQKGENALFYAILFEEYELMNKLIDKGIDYTHANNRGETPLWLASRKSDYRFAERLINLGVDIEKEDRNFEMTPLMVASKYGKFKIVDLLLDANANINKKSPEGTAVDLANKYRGQTFTVHGKAGFNCVEMIRKLEAYQNNKKFIPRDYESQKKSYTKDNPHY